MHFPMLQMIRGGFAEMNTDHYDETNVDQKEIHADQTEMNTDSQENAEERQNEGICESEIDEQEAHEPEKPLRKDPPQTFGGRFYGIIALLLVASMAFGAIGGATATHLLLSGDPATSDENKTPSGDNAASTTGKHELAGIVVSPSEGSGTLTVAQVNEKVASSVVAIKTSAQMQSNSYGGFYVTTGAGSGVILSAEGYIITNHHVIDTATEIDVTLYNGHVYPATVVDGDPATDIAILKITPNEALYAVEVGSSSGLVVGEEVVAVGNPLGVLPGTVTNGIVSALNRVLEVNGYKRTLIQTNTAISPGNSGGGLFDCNGKLVGIVNAKQIQEGAEGLGFAIPIDTVMELIVEIIENGYIHGRACLDLEIQEINSASEAYYLYYNQSIGIYITSSNYGEEIDLKKGDRIVMINGTQITKKSDLNRILAGWHPGDTVTLTVGRMEIVSSGYWTQYREIGIEVTVTLKEYVPDSSITFE